MAQLFQPTNITPDMRGPVGNGTIIDYSSIPETVPVSWQVNGNTPMTAFQIDFYLNDDSGTLIYSTGKQTYSCPFYGMNQDGTVNMFKYTVAAFGPFPTEETIMSAGAGRMIITQWWGDGANDYVVQASPSVYNVRQPPWSAVLYNGSQITSSTTITKRTASFTGSLNNLDGDGLIWTRWTLKDPDGNILKDTGRMYGSVPLTFSYDGFLPREANERYNIQLDAETDSGLVVYSYDADFKVIYDLEETGIEVFASKACNGESAVLVSWPVISTIPLIDSGGHYSMAESYITLSKNSYLEWNQVNGSSMSFSYPWSVIWKGTIDGTDGNVIEISLSGGASLYVMLSPRIPQTRSYRIFYVISTTHGTSVGTLTSLYNEHDPVCIALTTNGFYFYTESAGQGALLPSDNLYPENNLYPSQGNYGAMTTIRFSDTYAELLNGLSIKAVQIGDGANGRALTTDYLQIVDNALDESGFLQKAQSNTVPVYDSETLFLLRPNEDESYNAGNFWTDTPSSMTGLTLYRKTAGSNALEFIKSMSLSTNQILDYSAKSQQGPYTYYLYVEGSDTYQTMPAISNDTNPCFWNWTVLSCTKDSDGNYAVQTSYLFGKNLASGSISNNNKPNVLGNFTPYPLVQLSQQNYKSGTLESLIGTIDYADGQNQYSDTVDLKEAIYALSTTSNYLFLKSRKGDLWMIRPSGDITMTTMDNTKEQAQTVRFPWVEVGDASDVSIYQIP